MAMRRVLAAAAALSVALPAMPLLMQSSINIQSLPFRPVVRAGRFIYLAGALATDAEGRLQGGDVKAQTARVLENQAATLQSAGTDLAHVVSATVYLKRASDFAAMNEVYGRSWPSDPPARTTVIADLVLPDALVEISMVAVPKGAERVAVHPAAWQRSPSPYSYGILTGDTLFLAGLVSRNIADNTVMRGDITAQVRTAMEHAGEILRAAGMSYGDVVSSRAFITDRAHVQAMNDTYRTYFSGHPPARATVRAGLTASEYLFAVAMVAVRGADRQAITTPNADGTPGAPNPNLSSAIRVGDRLFVSGMLGNSDATRGDAATQTRETLARIGRTLAAAGFAWRDVVDGVVYLTDVGNYSPMNTAYAETFGTIPFPARATVITGLVAPDALVEIMVTADRSASGVNP
jgi:enamine deaminase RidA (YjgF/YER057c/UK114 family)